MFNFSVLGGPRIPAHPCHVRGLTPPWASKINEKHIFSIQNPSKTFCNLPRALWKRHRASWSLERMFLDQTPDSGLRTTGLAGLKTGPRRFPAAQSSQNHHKISSNPHRNPSKTSCNLPRHLWKRHRASWSLSRVFLDSPPDAGLRTPYSGLPIETRSLQEIIIKNHKPKSFSSSVEHPHKDSAWFTKSQNSQCEAAPHSVT